MPLKFCFKCKEEIKDKSYVTADDQTYDLDCFCCKKCTTKLGGKDYIKKNEDFWC